MVAETASFASGWVVCLCAAWCRTCEAYRTVFDSVAAQYPHLRFVWLDVEDEADLVGDLDVETFPTLLIADGDGVRFLGPLPPQVGVLVRMLTHAPSASPQTPEVQALWERIQAGAAG
ncbi:MAG: thioredoxin family protein [Burkholderiaceae bacterium]|nr:thioredoxin family protein [Burkholderiaceae bacterium]